MYDNRELSWLKFNMRVLLEAQNKSTPLLERLNFLDITTRNLDEFFMVRVGRLTDRIERGEENTFGMPLTELYEKIYNETKIFYDKKRVVYSELKDELKNSGISIYDYENLLEGKKNIASKKFESYIKPLLFVKTVFCESDFPHIDSATVCVALLLQKKDKKYLGLVIKNPCLNDVISLYDDNRNEFVLTDDIILKNSPKLFSGYKILDKCLFKITRNGDIKNLDNEFSFEDDYRVKMKKLLKKRAKLSPVCLEISKEISRDFKKLLLRKTGLCMVFVNKSPLLFSFSSDICKYIGDNLKNELSEIPHIPKIPDWFISGYDMLQKIKKRDVFLSYPYHSMKPFLEFLDWAASDEKTTSIKISLYRMNLNSRVIHSLIKASENGKEVVAVVELRARFSEENNINYSEMLIRGGVRVVYGIKNFKIHSKVCLVTRKNKNNIEYYTHIGTGNYNENTAKLYTDLNIITADYDIGKDAELLFNNIFTGNLFGTYKKLIVSPYAIENLIMNKLSELILEKNEGKTVSAVLKCNALTNKSVIEKIYEAAVAGVEIKLIVRGACCLIPDEKINNNIKIISVVGRFLEHSRIYAFYKNEKREIYISSADLMTRNLRHRVEVMVPIENESIKNEIEEILNAQLKDNEKAHFLEKSGEYVKLPKEPYFNSQLYLMNKETRNKNSDTNEKSKKKFGSFFLWLIKK